jgi:hypothetical protein
MTIRLRAALLACASFVALAFSGTALAAYTPKLIVNHTPPNVSSSSTQIVVSLNKDDDPTARITFYIPLGYAGVLGQAAGTQIGTVSSHIVAQQISKDAVLPINGVIRTDDPAKYVSNPCSPGTHNAVWLLSLEASGQTLNVPVYIDTVSAGTDAQFASFKMVTCLPSPDVPPPIGATLGAKLVDATLNLTNVFTAPTSQGQYVWPAVFTPYTPGAATPNAAGTVQARAVVRLPGQVTLKGKVTSKKKRTAVLSGSVTENLTGIVGAQVQLLLAGKAGPKKTTGAGGKYSFTIKRTGKGKAKTTVYRTRAVVPARDMGTVGCSLTITGVPPVPCVSATASAFTVTSAPVRVKL